MAVDEFQTASSGISTPFAGLRNLPAILAGVPMTKGINRDLQASFTAGRIHAYGFRNANWGVGEAGTTVVYSGTRYDDGSGAITQVVHKYFDPNTFAISTFSYIWFFTRTPLSVGQAALNAP